MKQRRHLRYLAATAIFAVALSCGDADERRVEQALLTADGEDGGARGLLSLNYEITSGDFKKWKQAQLSLDRTLGKAQSRSLKAFILGESPSREAIERAVGRIQGNARARKAIEDAGMSPRHYVVATVALFQATRGIDPITGEAFRGVPARNVEFAQQNRDEIESGEESGAFQEIADSIAAARAAMDEERANAVDVIIDTVPRVPMPQPPSIPSPPLPTQSPAPTPTPTPIPPTPGSPGGTPL